MPIRNNNLPGFSKYNATKCIATNEKVVLYVLLLSILPKLQPAFQDLGLEHKSAYLDHTVLLLFHIPPYLLPQINSASHVQGRGVRDNAFGHICGVLVRSNFPLYHAISMTNPLFCTKQLKCDEYFLLLPWQIDIPFEWHVHLVSSIHTISNETMSISAF